MPKAIKKKTAVKSKSKASSVSFLAFSCPHCPLQDNEAIDFMLGKIEDTKPDYVIHLGDGHEADSASRFPTEYDWTLAFEYEQHNELLQKIRKVSPSSKRIFIPGNHDQNLQAINRIDKKVRDLCDYIKHEPELREHWTIPCDYIYDREKGCYRLGQVTFAHGYEANGSADESQSILLGVPFGLYVGGHTHRPTEAPLRAKKTARLPLPYWYANAGCMRDMRPEYMRRNRSVGWGQAVVTGECNPSVTLSTTREWSAEVHIFRMAQEM